MKEIVMVVKMIMKIGSSIGTPGLEFRKRVESKKSSTQNDFPPPVSPYAGTSLHEKVFGRVHISFSCISGIRLERGENLPIRQGKILQEGEVDGC